VRNARKRERKSTSGAFLPIALIAAFSNAAFAESSERDETTAYLPDVSVTAKQDGPVKSLLDPKAPVQPIPPADGAGLLKTVPNMSVARKGGSSGDPLFRGLGGSRLPITTNDDFLYGGCGGRMDPPTAYIFPSSYDSVVVTKGPQTVIFPGVIAGSVQFLRNDRYFKEASANGDIGVTIGSFGRSDSFADVTAGMRYGYIRANAASSRSEDYRDGGGDRAHSAFERNSQTAQIGLTPDEYTLAELTYDRSRGEAAFADRGMDGAKFDRDAYKIRLSKYGVTNWLNAVNLQYGHSYVDHVMDNYSLRTAGTGMMAYMASNPDRQTDTASFNVDISARDFGFKIGADWLNDLHRSRSGSGANKAAADNYKRADRIKNQEADNVGVFIETDYKLNENNSLVFGLRRDKSGVDYYTIGDKNGSKDFELNAAFLRYEYRQEALTYFAGAGFAQRSPDFWERIKDANRKLNAETNKELDLGVLYNSETLNGSLNLFASEIEDFILVYSDSTTKNVDARRYGTEGEITWAFAPNYKLGAAIAYTYGKNVTYDKALGQTPPPEFRTSFGYDNGVLSSTITVRYAAAQRRAAIGEGNIIGQDVNTSAAFTVVSLNFGWNINKNFALFVGADNIFDKKYAEFINKKSVDVAGYAPSSNVQIYEPGRQYWARLQGKF
jgi:iron complex outermembrane receptor protein